MSKSDAEELLYGKVGRDHLRVDGSSFLQNLSCRKWQCADHALDAPQKGKTQARCLVRYRVVPVVRPPPNSFCMGGRVALGESLTSRWDPIEL